MFVTYTCNPGMLVLVHLNNIRHPAVSPPGGRGPLFLDLAISTVPLHTSPSFRPPPSYPRAAWSEISDALLKGQTTTDRPVIVARVFHANLCALG